MKYKEFTNLTGWSTNKINVYVQRGKLIKVGRAELEDESTIAFLQSKGINVDNIDVLSEDNTPVNSIYKPNTNMIDGYINQSTNNTDNTFFNQLIEQQQLLLQQQHQLEAKIDTILNAVVELQNILSVLSTSEISTTNNSNISIDKTEKYETNDSLDVMIQMLKEKTKQQALSHTTLNENNNKPINIEHIPNHEDYHNIPDKDWNILINFTYPKERLERYADLATYLMDANISYAMGYNFLEKRCEALLINYDEVFKNKQEKTHSEENIENDWELTENNEDNEVIDEEIDEEIDDEEIDEIENEDVTEEKDTEDEQEITAIDIADISERDYQFKHINTTADDDWDMTTNNISNNATNEQLDDDWDMTVNNTTQDEDWDITITNETPTDNEDLNF